MNEDDNPGGEQAPADAGAQASGAKWSEVDLSDLDAEQAAAAAGEGDEGEGEADSTDEGDGADDDSSSEEDADENDEGGEQSGGEPRTRRSRSDRYRDQIARLEAENQQLRGRSAAGQQERSSPHDDFDAALDEAERIVAEEQDRERVERHQEDVEAFRTRGTTPEERKANAMAYDAAMAAARNNKVTPHVRDLILDSDNSAHLQFYLAKNPQRLDAINRMSERDAARAIGGIEARLSLPKPKVKSSAPPPRSAPRGGAAPTSEDGELNAYLAREYGPQRR